MLHDSKRVSVGVRIRPKLDGVTNATHTRERYEQVACSLQSDTTLLLWDGRAAGDSRTFSFTYDCVFDENASQTDVYDELASAAVANVLSGTNATVLTYGQTGSGKTYTVLGGMRKNTVEDEIITDETGILLRALEEILQFASVQKRNRHVVVGISAVEIYLDDVRDLLRSEQTPASIQMTIVKDFVRFPKLTYVPVEKLEDGLAVFQRAIARRAERMTSANDTSSRSHAVFTIEVFQQAVTPKNPKPMDFTECHALMDAAQKLQLEGKPLQPLTHKLFEGASNPLFSEADAPVMYSKLLLADLAGSEKVRAAVVQGEAFDELKKINTSLTALGNVVHHLHEGSRYIPYRDSKLTTVLSDSFSSPNSRVVLIVNVSPTVLTVDETLSTLYFADKVKMMKGPSGITTGVKANVPRNYFSSLHVYDELISEMRIAGKMHQISLPQIIPLLADDNANVLYDLAFRVRRPDSEIRRMAVSTMCDVFRAAVKDGCVSANQKQQQQQELENAWRDSRDAIVGAWRQRMDKVHAHILRLSAGEQSSREPVEERDWNQQLEEAAASLKEARAARRDAKQKRAVTMAGLGEAVNTIKALDDQIQSWTNTLSVGGENADAAVDAGTVLGGQDDNTWTLISMHCEQALASARARLELCTLMSETYHLASELKDKQQQQPPHLQNVYDWLYHAVRAMAGNAVAIVLKQEKRRYQSEPEMICGHPGLKDYGVPRPRPYWQRRTTEISSRSSTVTTTTTTDSEDSKKKRSRSQYDNTEFLEEITSFTRMGGEMQKFSHNGRVHRRLFYVDGKPGDERFYWSSVSSWAREGCIPLRTVRRILLGQEREGGAVASRYLTWGIVYQSDSGTTKTLNFACDSVFVLEIWVIALSRLTRVQPVFAEPMERQAEAEWDELSGIEAAFCMEWHVPPDVYLEARRQIMHRRRHAALRLSPGQLRNLVNLDIFRASAMWLRFHADGLVMNPENVLCCYVEVPAALEANTTGMRRSSVISLGHRVG